MGFSLASSYFRKGDILPCGWHHGQGCTWPVHSVQFLGAPLTHRDEELMPPEGRHILNKTPRYLETSGHDSRSYIHSLPNTQKRDFSGVYRAMELTFFNRGYRLCSIHMAAKLNPPLLI